MKKTILLSLSLLGITSIQAVDWSSLLGGEAPAQQQAPQKQFNWSDLLSGQQAQTQTQQAASTQEQPGFFQSMSTAVKVAQDPEIKALMEAKMAEYANLGFFDRMSKVMNDPQLKDAIEAKMSGRRVVVAQQPISQRPVYQQSVNQQPVAKSQQGFDWSSLFGANRQQEPVTQSQQTQQAGFDWSSLFGGGQQQSSQQGAQQSGFDWTSLFGGNKQAQPQQQTQGGGFGQMLMRALENTQQ